jgi:hypothetical protein
MTQEEIAHIPDGVYRLFWNAWPGCNAGQSVAAVGTDSQGKRWFAPANWVTGIPCFEWHKVRAISPICAQTYGTLHKEGEREREILNAQQPI